ncbi:MAG TPA: hypothetical protein VK547_17505 [Candidatus Udaeobacter sp.]|nr:hypothetical protein [Candidatus Udaeobacter sp.]
MPDAGAPGTVGLEPQPQRRAARDLVTRAQRHGLPGRQRPFDLGEADAVQGARAQHAPGGRGEAMHLVEDEPRAAADHAEVASADHPGARGREPEGGLGGHAIPRRDGPERERPGELQQHHHRGDERHREQRRRRPA